ncbi:hypothetical protein IFM89_030165 [Coptis chinensis]|uniref:Uncharacterized protein n=1 Tax=Coptis chinensis TaxID=261450 RepID=A0A835GYT1_9MAGN|nr:hypothetical protein IFM89_030165 [Coptis chinensis]
MKLRRWFMRREIPLENYAYNMRNTIKGEKIGAKLDPVTRRRLRMQLTEAIRWLDKESSLPRSTKFDDKIGEHHPQPHHCKDVRGRW